MYMQKNHSFRCPGIPIFYTTHREFPMSLGGKFAFNENYYIFSHAKITMRNFSPLRKKHTEDSSLGHEGYSFFSKITHTHVALKKFFRDLFCFSFFFCFLFISKLFHQTSRRDHTNNSLILVKRKNLCPLW